MTCTILSKSQGKSILSNFPQDGQNRITNLSKFLIKGFCADLIALFNKIELEIKSTASSGNPSV
jgi:hypothetical protein